MWILVFSLVFLVGGFLVGWFLPTAKFWDWVDTIYYPLAIGGVILLYFESTGIREIAFAEQQQRTLERQLEEIDEVRPEIRAQLSGQRIVHGAGELLSVIAEMARACERAPSTNASCFVAEDFAPIIERGEAILLAYQDERDLAGVCDTAENLFHELAENAAVSTFLTEQIAQHYFEGLEKDFEPVEFGAVQTYIEGLRPQLEAEAARMVRVLQLDSEDLARMEPHYEAHIDYGMLTIKAFEVCMRAPENVRSGYYAEWASKRGATQSEYDQKLQELHQLRIEANQLGTAAIFRASYWPFLIVLALALKFSKGVAHVRDKFWLAAPAE